VASFKHLKNCLPSWCIPVSLRQLTYTTANAITVLNKEFRKKVQFARAYLFVFLTITASPNKDFNGVIYVEQMSEIYWFYDNLLQILQPSMMNFSSQRRAVRLRTYWNDTHFIPFTNNQNLRNTLHCTGSYTKDVNSDVVRRGKLSLIQLRFQSTNYGGFQCYSLNSTMRLWILEWNGGKP